MSNKRWVLDNANNNRNRAVLKTLKDICPKYADHMFDHNRIFEAFYMSDKGGINPFNMPLCGICEKPGTRIEDPAFIKQPDATDRLNCYCENHGITYNVKDLRLYLIEDLKIPPTAIMQLELLLYGGVS